jgi:hypothetical protein
MRVEAGLVVTAGQLKAAGATIDPVPLALLSQYRLEMLEQPLDTYSGMTRREPLQRRSRRPTRLYVFWESPSGDADHSLRGMPCRYPQRRTAL